MGFYFGLIGSALIILIYVGCYREFLLDFLRFLVDHFFQALLLVLAFVLLYGQVGQGLGLPLLFWSEEPWSRFSVSLSVTLLLAVIGINAYYLIPDKDFTDVIVRVRSFLNEGNRAGTLTRAIRKFSAVVFLDFRWLEPSEDEGSNSYLLSRFLRLVRLPFLTLTILPAIFPRFFFNLPRYAPVVKDIQLGTFHDWINIDQPDVYTSWLAYLWSLLVWCSGIIVGILIVKFFILISFWIHRMNSRKTTEKRSSLRRGAKERRLGLSILLYVVSVLIVVFVMSATPIYDGEKSGIWSWLALIPVIQDYRGIAPGAAIFALLSLLSLVNSFLNRLAGCQRSEEPNRLAGRYWLPVIWIVLIVLISWINSTYDCYRFEKLDYSKGKQGPFQYILKDEVSKHYLVEVPAQEAEQKQDNRPTESDLDRWKNKCKASKGTQENQPKLVIVCTSGGAIRAGYWTATVLDRLGAEIPGPTPTNPADPQGFHAHVRLITGASGGMVGASYYVTWLRDRMNLGSPADGIERLPKEAGWLKVMPILGLDRIARFMALRDSVLLLGRVIAYASNNFPDRGIELELEWPHLRYPFSQLKAFEEAGQLPSLIFSPMTVEDGRRLLISNLDLDFQYNPDLPPRQKPIGKLQLMRSKVFEADAEPDALTEVSLTGIEFFKVFPRKKGETANNEIMVSTAPRMSASFPFVSPAVYLPTVPPLRVVDAGYYDNYGVDIAAAWIFSNRDWIKESTSGVLVVQIRDALSVADRLGYKETEGTYAWLLRGLQFFSSPIEGALKARTASGAFRNDALISALGEYFTEQTKNREFFSTAIFELASRTIQPKKGIEWEWPGDGLDLKIELVDASQSSEVAMSWYLSVAERQAIDHAIPFTVKPDAFLAARDFKFGAGTKGRDLAKILGLSEKDIDISSIEISENRAMDLKGSRINRLKELKSVREAIAKNTAIQERYREPALTVIDKEIARANNYERLREIEAWWTNDHSKPANKAP